MSNAATTDELDLGTHEGLPITERQIIINKTGDGLSKAMPFDPFDIAPDSEHFLNVHVRHRKTRFDNVYSKDDTDKLIGFIQIDILEATGVTRWADDVAADATREMERKIVDAAEKAKAEKKGQFRLPEDAVVDAEGRDATIHEMPGRVSAANIDPDEIIEEIKDAGEAVFLAPDTDVLLGDDPSDD